ncbi:long-chain-alcohol oxidase FAO4A [Populus alba x Populus x berolinensis]|uniref:long-chain-alcohol oxidase n=2 Tax=Populus alba x Populus x berolinensis TaxID=444605 RepID=A0AAD6R4I6_9ROSI|nr:long-chain-alcohol oxidase FAO4A [Populus alba x Populus x berolinensis]
MEEVKKEQQEEAPIVVDLGSIDTQGLFVGGEKQSTCSYVNSLSSREMESLTAICDTLFPSVYNSSMIAASADDGSANSISTFYQSSASMAGTPQRVGELFCERVQHPKKWLIRLTLYLLSTWIGTFILCGLPSISPSFPYFLRFSQISQGKREQIVFSWATSFFYLLRMLFKAIKLVIPFVFFSQVDEKNENLTWKAIGYPGPDPAALKRQTQTCGLPETLYASLKDDDDDQHDCKEEHLFGPLYRGLVDLNLPSDRVADSLRQIGFPVSILRGKNIDSPRDFSTSNPSLVIKCDAVVVGSGSGGGVVAGVLAKAGYKVLVLEKGNYFARNNLSLLEGPSMDEMYLGAGMLASDDMGVVVLAGSTVGGGSAINWSASIKTPQHVINEWSESYDLELFDSKLYKEALDAVCEKMGVQSDIDEEGFNNAVLRRGCEELGYPVDTIPRNSVPDHYCGWCCFGCKDGRKKGTCETWLKDMVNSGNGAVLPGCKAIKVLHERKKGKDRSTASGVAFGFEYNGMKDLCVVESKVTIVAGGALSTPALLKASGLKNANIGKHLHLHPVTMAWGYFPEAPTSTTAWPEEQKKSYEGGIMTAMSTVVANFNKSGYGAVIQTPSLHPGMFSGLIPWISGADMKRRMSRFSRTAHVFALARDRGSGTVNSPSSINYRMDAEDEKNLQEGLEKTLRILAAAGAEEIGTHHSTGKSLNVKKVSYHEFERFVKEESARPLRDLTGQICSAHQMGSCRMGVNPKESAVNQTGEAWEVEGLFVADTSVFPTALGVNPMVTVQAIAYCTAQSVVQLLSRKRTHY